MKIATGQDYFGSKVEGFFPGFVIAVINGLLLGLASLIIGYLLFWIFKPFEPLRTYFTETSSPKQADVKIEGR